MGVQKNIIIEADAQISIESRDQWVEQHAHRVQRGFEKWQHANGIDGQAYRKYLETELAAYWDDPLLKSLIESI